jgi:hypothetical protein
MLVSILVSQVASQGERSPPGFVVAHAIVRGRTPEKRHALTKKPPDPYFRQREFARTAPGDRLSHVAPKRAWHARKRFPSAAAARTG